MTSIRVCTALRVALCLLLWIGCSSPNPPDAYVARVGDTYLMEQDVEAALASVPPGRDSSSIRRQYVEQWVTNTLLLQEAQRRDVGQNPQVQQRLQANERTVLIDALIDELNREEIPAPTAAELAAYYERHKDQLRLREPFVRVRYLASTSADSAAEVRQLLQRATASGQVDSLWPGLVQRFAIDVEGSLLLSSTYYPESQLFNGKPALPASLNRLGPGQIAPVLEADSIFHVLQLADRIATGSIPELSWIEEDVRRRLLIDGRKQMYARHVQRLRNEAQAKNAIEIR